MKSTLGVDDDVLLPSLRCIRLQSHAVSFAADRNHLFANNASDQIANDVRFGGMHYPQMDVLHLEISLKAL